MAYDQNLKTAMTGEYGSVNPDPVIQQGSKATHGAIEDGADVRDILSAMVGNGYTDFKSPDVKNYLAYLSSKIGVQPAQQMFRHIFIFNQRDDIKLKNPEQRIGMFYNTVSNDPDTNNIVKGAASFGMQDPVSAARTSIEVGNMQATGRLPKDTGSGDSASADKIKSIAAQTTKKLDQ